MRRGTGPDQGRQNWRTPPELFAALSRRWGPFGLDLAADHDNHLCPDYFTAEDSAFDYIWGECNAFLNNPFEQMALWLPEVRRQADMGTTITMLCPLDSGVAWFPQHAWGKFDSMTLLAPRVSYIPPPERVKPPSSASGSSVVLRFLPLNSLTAPEDPTLDLMIWRKMKGVPWPWPAAKYTLWTQPPGVGQAPPPLDLSKVDVEAVLTDLKEPDDG